MWDILLFSEESCQMRFHTDPLIAEFRIRSAGHVTCGDSLYLNFKHTRENQVICLHAEFVSSPIVFFIS